MAVAAIALIAPKLLQSTILEPWFLVESLFFVAAPNPGTGFYEPLLVPGWTLNNEMAFYCLFAVAIALSVGSVMRRGLIIAGLILAAASVPLLFPKVPGTVLFYANSTILEFLFGIGVGAVWMLGRVKRRPAWWFFVGLGFVTMALGAFVVPGAPRVIGLGVPALLIVGGAAFSTPIRSPLKWLGDTSYSLYLSHGIALSALGQIWQKLGLASASPVVFINVALVVCIVGAALVFYGVERPLGRLAKAMVARRASYARERPMPDFERDRTVGP